MVCGSAGAFVCSGPQSDEGWRPRAFLLPSGLRHPCSLRLTHSAAPQPGGFVRPTTTGIAWQ